MNWHYEFNKEQRGPVDGRELLATFQSGVIKETSLVWNENLTGWEPLSQHLDALRAEAGVLGTGAGQLPEMAVCAYSGNVMERSEMVPYGDQWIAPEHKDAFVQSLMEGKRLDATAAIDHVEYAGFWIRVLAKIIDSMIVSVAAMLLLVPFVLIYGVENIDLESEEFGTMLQVAIQIPSIFLGYLYNAWMIWKYQATLGKMALGVKVILPDGGHISFLRATGRYFAEMLSGLICYVGYIIAGFDAEKRALHDHICGTRVVKK